jgi:hypothetical protein
MTPDIAWYGELSGKVLQGIGARTNPEIGKYFEDIDGLEHWDIAFLQIGYAFAPQPLTVQGYIERGPYGNPDFYAGEMNQSVSRGWLTAAGDGQYTLSEKGTELVEDFLGKWDGWFGSLPSLGDPETPQLANLLQKLVNAAAKTPQFDPKPTLKIGLNFKPGPDAAHMLRVRRHLVDLTYYREDAHIAAWQPYKVDGRTWEVLTFVWRGEASTAADLAENLSEYRHYTEEDYAATLESLVSQGWAIQEAGKYVLSEAGKNLRQEAEDKTDEYFAIPFSTLTEDELKTLKGFMEKLADQLPPLEEPDTSTE